MMDEKGYGSDSIHYVTTGKYLDFQLGHITEQVMIVNHSLSLSDAVEYFHREEKASGLAVEEEKVIGILSRETALEKAASRMELLKGKTVKSYLVDDSIRFDASDSCEKAFYKVIGMEDREIKNLIIYEGTHFFGIIPIKHLIMQVTRIREMSYEQAHYIQQFFIDKSACTIPGLDFSSAIRMAHQIGGDFYHAKAISEDRSLFACFDVASKDIAASLTTGLLSSFFSMYFTLEKGEYDPRSMVRELNRILVEQTPPDVFVVALILSFDLKERMVKVFNHGFSPLYVCTPKEHNTAKLSKINPNFMPLGINEEIDFSSAPSMLPFVPHTKFFIYSDGLPDAINVHGTRYGEARIKDFVMEHIAQNPEGFLKSLLEEFDAYTKDAVQVDDFTAIAIEILT